MGLPQEIPLGLAQIIAFAVGVGIPLVVSLVTKYNAPLWVKSAVSFASALLTAGGLYLADVSGAHTWLGLLTALAAAALSAGSTKSAYTGGVVTDKIARATPNFGVGGAKLDEASLAVVKTSYLRKPNH